MSRIGYRLVMALMMTGVLSAGGRVMAKGGNLVQNPGFEQGLRGWTADPSSLAIRVTGKEKHAGAQALEIPPHKDSEDKAKQAVAVDNNKAYEIAVQVKPGEGSDHLMLFLRHRLAGEQAWHTRMVANGMASSTEWTRIAGRIYLREPAPIAEAFIYVLAGKPQITTFLDDFSVQEIKKIPAELIREQQAFRLAENELRPVEKWGYMIEPGDFPAIGWTRPLEVKMLVGEFPLSVRWFDSNWKEVAKAEKPGRYAAIIDGKTPSGIHIRRAVTVYCRTKDWRPWGDDPRATLQYLPGGPLSQAALETHKDTLASVMGQALIQYLETQPEGGVIAAGMSEISPEKQAAEQFSDPFLLDQDYHVALKLKLMGWENKTQSLSPPRKKAGAPATVLRTGTLKEGGAKPDTFERIHKACKEWYDASHEPFAAVVARRGVIIYQESFGGTPERPITLATRFPLASITKLFTGLLFAQFLDQGLIRPDDMVGRYLPDFQVTGNKAITLRHCLTHTTGLDGHGEWGGVNNPYLENTIATLSDTFTPGRTVNYNGMGYDLAGKVMEAAAGKGIFRLFQENFFLPLGMKDQAIHDLAYSVSCTPEELARVGQLMLNQGSYGETEFFTPKTYAQLLPRPFDEMYPDLKGRIYPPRSWGWGLGIIACVERHPESGRNGHPRDEAILSDKTVGHGAASSTVLRVDPEHELVVAMGRITAGPDYDKYLTRFLLAVRDSLETP